MLQAEALRFSLHALRANKLRTFLTALGLVIGNASVILVVTISITSREYVLDQIRSIGSNMIYAQYEAGNNTVTKVEADWVNLSDLEAIRKQLGPRIIAATGVMVNYDNLRVAGRDEDIAVVGSDEQYPMVRNLALIAGRFIDPNDVGFRRKTAMLTEKLARRLYGSQQMAIGKRIKLHGLEFDVVGTFKERTESFGLSELASETVYIPITVMRYFVPALKLDPLYVQVRRAEDVELLTPVVKQIIESRHRAGARYKVENLSAILDAAKNIALIMTLVLILVSAICLITAGIGIMNIMLVTVTERTREIGLRMAVGAARGAILSQFLTEAVMISVAGGTVGIAIGVAVPLTIEFLVPDVPPIPISWISVAVAFGVSFIVGLVAGLVPANRAAQMNPTEALRYE